LLWRVENVESAAMENTGVRETLRREVGPARVENCRDRLKAICKRRMPSAAEVCSFLSQTDFCSITDLLTDTLKQAFENTALILRKHFRRELDIIQNEVLALAMSGLVMGLKKGEGWAVCFTLKARGGWQEINAHRFVNEQGKDCPFVLSDADRLIAEADAEISGQ